MTVELPTLCSTDGCRRITGHSGDHDPVPSEAWDFLSDQDKNKIAKAGFATPRGGPKQGYQNHVIRSGKVIIPFERLSDVNLTLYADGYVIRVLPEQYFDGPGTPKQQFLQPDSSVKVGDNAFILYRTHDSFETLPPLPTWQVRHLLKAGEPTDNRGNGAVDVGHYLLRMSKLGPKEKRFEGPPQGIFAPEYADENTNYLSKCVLALLIVQTSNSPYTLSQAGHLRAILRDEELDNCDCYEHSGLLRRGLTSCPLCMRLIAYPELHATVSFADEGGLANASEQVQGATRSTVVNLFHLMPLAYHELTHIPSNLGWGHAVCNTRLGQRPCYSLKQLIAMNRKVGILRDEGLFESFGWISTDWLMIRSPNGAVWMQLNGDIKEGPPEEPGLVDSAADVFQCDDSEREDSDTM